VILRALIGLAIAAVVALAARRARALSADGAGPRWWSEPSA
jgi:hypothetical protein